MIGRVAPSFASHAQLTLCTFLGTMMIQRTANKATEEASKIVRKVPTWNEVKGDWRVWVGLMALISVGLSVLSAPQAPPPSIGSSSSYYI